jgi:hypothetical protein
MDDKAFEEWEQASDAEKDAEGSRDGLHARQFVVVSVRYAGLTNLFVTV